MIRKIILTAMLFSVLIFAKSKSINPTFGIGSMMDRFPIPVAEVKIFTLNFYLEKELINKNYFDLGMGPGIYGLMLLPIPYFQVSTRFLPEPLQISLKGVLMWDVVYANIPFGGLKTGVIINKQLSIEVVMLWGIAGYQGVTEYPRRASDMFRKVIKHDPDKIKKDPRAPGHINYPLSGIQINLIF